MDEQQMVSHGRKSESSAVTYAFLGCIDSLKGDVIMAGDGMSENMYNVYHTPHPALGTFSERIYAFTLPDEDGPYWALDEDGMR